MLWLRAKCLRTALVPQMPGKFPLLVPPWSTLSEGLLTFYLWSQDWNVPSFPPLGNWGCGEWGSDGRRVRGSGLGWGRLAWPKPLVTQSLVEGGNFWGLQAFTKPQELRRVPEQPGANEITLKKERDLNASIRPVLWGRPRANFFWEMKIPSGWNDLYSAKCFVLKSPLSRHWVLVLSKVQNIFFLAHFQIYWGARVTHPILTY